jgi:hypothetical protein
MTYIICIGQGGAQTHSPYGFHRESFHVFGIGPHQTEFAGSVFDHTEVVALYLSYLNISNLEGSAAA